MQETGQNEKRFNITYFDGVNSIVNHLLAKRVELLHAENIRSKLIGVIEKREGQQTTGTNPNGSAFVALQNYGIAKFLNIAANKGVLRVSSWAGQSSTYMISVFDDTFVTDVFNPSTTTTLKIRNVEYVAVSEGFMKGLTDQNALILDGTGNSASIFVLDNNNAWQQVSGAAGQNMAGAPCSFARVENNILIVNQHNYNVMLKNDANTIIDSTTAGSLYNSPRAKKAAFYKSRIYLANFIRSGVQYRTTVIRSSYSLGVIALVNGDSPNPTDPSQSPLGITAVSIPSWATFIDNGNGTGTLSGTAPATDTNDNVELRVTNAVYGSLAYSDQKFTISTRSSTTAPYFTSKPGTTAASGGSYTYNITTANPAAHAVTITSSTIPAGLVLTDNGNGTATLTGTVPVNGSDSYPAYDDVNIVVTDPTAGASTVQKWSITVPANANQPFLNSTPATAILANGAFSYTVQASYNTPVWAIPVTNSDYFYANSGMNQYDIYRGAAHIATVTLTSVQETTITAAISDVTFYGNYNTLLSADEIWIAGTYNGEKQYRWINNPTGVGRDVKQYDTFFLSGGDEDEITLMETIGNVLLIANKNAMCTWNDYTLQNFDLGFGCVSPNGYVKLLGTLYFIHYSGIYSTSGTMPQLLSRKIDRYIKGATRTALEQSACGFKGLSVFFTLGDVKLYNDDDSYWKTLKDCCIEYNVADQNWYVHTNVPATQFAQFLDVQGGEHCLYTSSKTGAPVKEFLIGNTDDGAEIFMRADTQVIQLLPNVETYAMPISVITEMDRGSLTKCFISLDKGEFYELEGEVTKGISIMKINGIDRNAVSPPLARRIQLSYRDSSKQLNKIIQSTLVYAPTNMSNPAGI